MHAHNTFKIAVYPGDGIGTEVIAIAQAVLERLQSALGGFQLTFEQHAAGAA